MSICLAGRNPFRRRAAALRLAIVREETFKCRTGAVPIGREEDSAHARTSAPVGVFVYVPQTGVYARTGVSVYVNTHIHANAHWALLCDRWTLILDCDNVGRPS